jgi:hypothetical protein
MHHGLHHALDALVIGAMGTGAQFARDPPIQIPRKVTLHLRDGAPEFGIGIARLRVASARPSVVGTPRKPDHATSSPGTEAADPEMINDCALLVAEAAMSPLFSRSNSMVS